MNKKEKAKLVDERLEALYPDVACALEHHDDPFRLLIMAILSAQCTDARVNIVSAERRKTSEKAGNNHLNACRNFLKTEISQEIGNKFLIYLVFLLFLC